MDTKELFSRKADKYAKYRWDYSSDAVQAIFNITQNSLQSNVADIGAGTGILTKHFIGKVRTVYAIEPNPEMRWFAEKAFFGRTGCVVIPGSAESTTLPAGCVDLITVAQAIKWFDPEPARNEFVRISKPDGWLVILHNRGTNLQLEADVERIFTIEFGVDPMPISSLSDRKPPSFFFGNEDFQKFDYPFSFRTNWDSYLGALLSTSFVPDEDHPLFPKFILAARKIFDYYSDDGVMEVQGETELLIGKISL